MEELLDLREVANSACSASRLLLCLVGASSFVFPIFCKLVYQEFDSELFRRWISLPRTEELYRCGLQLNFERFVLFCLVGFGDLISLNV